MKVKTADLKGHALDWAVATTENTWDQLIGWSRDGMRPYSSDWGLAGPIIHRNKISVEYHSIYEKWFARTSDAATLITIYGPTPLIAAMRCHIMHVLGDSIEVPDELVEGV